MSTTEAALFSASSAIAAYNQLQSIVEHGSREEIAAALEQLQGLIGVSDQATGEAVPVAEVIEDLTPASASVSVVIEGRDATAPGAALAAAEDGELPSVGDVLQAWLGGKKAATIISYTADLQTFGRFLGVATIDDAARVLLGGGHARANRVALGFRNWLLDEIGAPPATVNRRLTSLRSLSKVARLAGLVPFAIDVGGVASESYRDTRGPGLQAERAILRHLAGSPDSPKARRDRAMFLLLAGMGLRSAEVRGLDIGHVELGQPGEDGAVRVLRKRRRQRARITMPAAVVEAVRSWLEVHPGGAALFVGLAPGCGRLTPQGLRSVLADLGVAATGKPVRPHQLRHGAVTIALDAGHDIRKVRHFSGHSKIETVAVYDDNRSDFGGQIARDVSALLLADDPAPAEAEA